MKKWIFKGTKTDKTIALERDSITARQMKEIYRDGFILIAIQGQGGQRKMKTYYCTAMNKEHLDSLTRDYRKAGYNIVTYGERLRELEKDNEFIVIEIAQPKRSKCGASTTIRPVVLMMAGDKGK